MRDYIYNLGDYIKSLINRNEDFLCNYKGEDSDFIRFNQSKIRQAGHVKQDHMTLTLMNGGKHISEKITLTGSLKSDKERIFFLVKNLRDLLNFISEDPHLQISKDVHSTENIKRNLLNDSDDILYEIILQSKNLDLVGIYSGGGIYYGFINSSGQKNWQESYSFNFDWSVFYKEDKAVKSGYAGFEWDNKKFINKMDLIKDQMKILRKSSIDIEPGKYNVFLSPRALASIMEILFWGGFSEKSKRTKTTPLIKMIESQSQLGAGIRIMENIKNGISPNFQSEGYIKPEGVVFINNGIYENSLVSPRTSKEYGIKTNGANSEESPVSLDMHPGSISEKEILNKLDTGIYINNLWYLNYSDRSACRITGMTRFACFWVENGKIEAPIGVMRFDETLYNILGENLIGITDQSEFIMDPGTYGGRSTGSMRLPGIIVKDFNFTL